MKRRSFLASIIAGWVATFLPKGVQAEVLASTEEVELELSDHILLLDDLVIEGNCKGSVPLVHVKDNGSWREPVEWLNFRGKDVKWRITYYN